MTRVVQILPRAAIQIFESASWWAENRSLAQAARWLVEIESAIAGLAHEAQRHPLASEAEAFDFPLHQMNFGISGRSTHRVLYSFDDAKVLIYAVRHLSQADLHPEHLS